MLATEIGVWTTENIFARNVVWTPDVQGMANVRVDMVKFRTSDNTVLAATHGRGMFTAKWNPVYTSGKTEVAVQSGLVEVFPNPSDGRFVVKLDNPGVAQLTIMDVAGKIVANEVIREQTGIWQKSFDLRREPRGVYLVKVVSQGKISATRVVLE